MKKFLLLSAVLAVQPIATHAVEYVDWVDWDQINTGPETPTDRTNVLLSLTSRIRKVPTRSFGAIAGMARKPARTLSALSLRRAVFSQQ